MRHTAGAANSTLDYESYFADEDAVQKLLNTLLMKNKHLAGDLFRWLRQTLTQEPNLS